jgi:hypothetical protein
MKTETERVLITSIAKRGNLGKSTVMAGIAGWLNQRGIAWQGFDLDPDHQSFVRLFPESVQPVPLGEEPEGDVIRVLRTVNAAPVTLLDPRAHLNGTILRAWDMIRFPETFAEAGGQIVVLLFPADDLEVMSDLDATVTRLGDRVDYLVVRNPARNIRTRMFDGSELEEELKRHHASFLDVPVLLSLARNHLAAKEAELGRGITHAEAFANGNLGLDPMVRLVVEDWMRLLCCHLDAVAGHILPSALVAKIAPTATASAQVVSLPARRGAKLNLKHF